nr:anticoagulant protein rhipilin-2-like [Dermacentor andersoni]
MSTCTSVLLFLVAALLSKGDSNEPRCHGKSSPLRWSELNNHSWTLTSYYYNETENRCKELGFLGCDGNNNKFSSLFECLAKCRKPNPGETIPKYLEKYLPNCTNIYVEEDKGNIARFNFNPELNECNLVIVGKGDKYFPQITYCMLKCNGTQGTLGQCRKPRDPGTEPEGWQCRVEGRYTTCNMQAPTSC